MVGVMEGAVMEVSIVALVMSDIYGITSDKCMQCYTSMPIYIQYHTCSKWSTNLPVSSLVL